MAPRISLGLVVGRGTTLHHGKERDGMAAKRQVHLSCRKPPSSSQNLQQSGQSSHHLQQPLLPQLPQPLLRSPSSS